jgi:hypothetical protein
MSDKSVFTDEEWHAVTDAPLLVTAAMIYTGEHGPISMLKEATASAHAIAKPGEHGIANALIGEIVAQANTKETRAELKEKRGPTPQAAVEGVLKELQPAADALNKLPADERAEVANWFVAIARAVAQSAKKVSPDEQATIDKIAKVFNVT